MVNTEKLDKADSVVLITGINVTDNKVEVNVQMEGTIDSIVILSAALVDALIKQGMEDTLRKYIRAGVLDSKVERMNIVAKGIERITS